MKETLDDSIASLTKTIDRTCRRRDAAQHHIAQALKELTPRKGHRADWKAVTAHLTLAHALLAGEMDA